MELCTSAPWRHSIAVHRERLEVADGAGPVTANGSTARSTLLPCARPRLLKAQPPLNMAVSGGRGCPAKAQQCWLPPAQPVPLPLPQAPSRSRRQDCSTRASTRAGPRTASSFWTHSRAPTCPWMRASTLASARGPRASEPGRASPWGHPPTWPRRTPPRSPHLPPSRPVRPRPSPVTLSSPAPSTRCLKSPSLALVAAGCQPLSLRPRCPRPGPARTPPGSTRNSPGRSQVPSALCCPGPCLLHALEASRMHCGLHGAWPPVWSAHVDGSPWVSGPIAPGWRWLEVAGGTQGLRPPQRPPCGGA